ncbi:guanine nucleotide-binding protein subunit alpha [Rhizophlyctis rosea]|uniref:Guanine nucleotide-binding protein subunit alpha n=1 Tax=Rhizophlyctis rosea TaxID=64517 RepID=A0AAD5S9T7_9FUNG|nr:guanine nucleotide-binding protein subunit alpha [Rhizophlyctis rosea]
MSHGVHHVLVEPLSGDTEPHIIAQIDLLRYLFSHNESLESTLNLSANDVMSKSLHKLRGTDIDTHTLPPLPVPHQTLTIRMQDSAILGFKKMRENRLTSVGVVDRSGCLISALSAANLRGLNRDRIGEGPVGDPDTRARHNEIEKQLRHDRADAERSVKLLLLGSGESGKSTILKQFKLIHGQPYSDAERMSFRPAVLGNLMSCAKTLVEAMEKLGVEYANEEAKETHAKAIQSAPVTYGEGEQVPPSVFTAISTLWKDSGIQEVFQRNSEYQLIDSCKYYMDDSSRLCSASYKPTDQDILRARVMTTTITESKFNISGTTFRIYDVGGQRSERKKWAPYFDDCNAIVFVAAISVYDQMCFEDNATNRRDYTTTRSSNKEMERAQHGRGGRDLLDSKLSAELEGILVVESMNLFDSICNHPLFRRTAMILFLNKIDLLKQKLPSSPIKNNFPNYEGPNEFEPACEYFAHRFVSLNRSSDKKIYIHFTWATDTSQIKTVIATVSAIVLRGNLENIGM